MKKNILSLFAIGIIFSSAYSQNNVLLETKYYSFQSNAQLNAHAYLYNRAMGCKYKKVSDDSLAYYSFKDKLKLLKPEDLSILKPVLMFYRDSLISKDFLFDSLMRDFSDKLSLDIEAKSGWQAAATARLKVFQPYFNKLYWKEIEADNKAWINAHKNELVKQELTVVPELERIYQTQLPSSKIVVDLTCYATWAGACSYKDSFAHIIFASKHGSNNGDLATEVVFHETSHFLVDEVQIKIAELTKGKDIKKTVNLWHTIIFYTTGYVFDNQFSTEAKKVVPFYVQMKFEDKFPDFKVSVEACKSYWDQYIKGQTTFDEAIKSVANFVQEKK
ncbi:hypothetical protein [Aurantibacillus circumpalustris]|uniref:hypothetical protein n=1 Tax=Aurantibacillus circumpalustris TaxID=3036359 RepID=UPI00295BEAA6|nr:hypothetical protein [Aurantibacillus circumpalustris]